MHSAASNLNIFPFAVIISAANLLSIMVILQCVQASLPYTIGSGARLQAESNPIMAIKNKVNVFILNDLEISEVYLKVQPQPIRLLIQPVFHLYPAVIRL